MLGPFCVFTLFGANSTLMEWSRIRSKIETSLYPNSISFRRSKDNGEQKSSLCCCRCIKQPGAVSAAQRCNFCFSAESMLPSVILTWRAQAEHKPELLRLQTYHLQNFLTVMKRFRVTYLNHLPGAAQEYLDLFSGRLWYFLHPSPWKLNVNMWLIPLQGEKCWIYSLESWCAVHSHWHAQFSSKRLELLLSCQDDSNLIGKETAGKDTLSSHLPTISS